MEKDRGLIAKLNDQVVNKAADADIQTTLNGLKANHNAMKEQMEKMQDQKDAILTPTQQGKNDAGAAPACLNTRMKNTGRHGQRKLKKSP